MAKNRTDSNGITMMTIEWLNGPHATFILLSYVISVVVVLIITIAPIIRIRQLRKQLRLQTDFEDDTQS